MLISVHVDIFLNKKQIIFTSNRLNRNGLKIILTRAAECDSSTLPLSETYQTLILAVYIEGRKQPQTQRAIRPGQNRSQGVLLPQFFAQSCLDFHLNLAGDRKIHAIHCIPL